jgi:hypothetical protein
LSTRAEVEDDATLVQRRRNPAMKAVGAGIGLAPVSARLLASPALPSDRPETL